ncbi:MAG: coproporphyrinogen III oxidase, partial [Dokdonella sp.]
IRADVIQRLMCHGELDMRAFGEHHGIAFREYFPVEMERIDALQADGLVVVTADRLTITARGRFLLRIVAMCFDAYLDAAPDGTRPTYSKAL